MTSLRVRRLLALPAVAALSLGVLAGCGGDDTGDGGDDASQGDGGSDDTGAADDADDAGDAGDADDAGDDGTDQPGDDATDETGGTDEADDLDLGGLEGFAGEVPDGFPEEVPLVDGDVQLGSEQGGVFAVAIGTDDSAEETYDEAAELLLAEGFEQEDVQEYDEVFTGSFSGDGLSVQVTTVTDEVSDGALITYAVSGG